MSTPVVEVIADTWLPRDSERIIVVRVRSKDGWVTTSRHEVEVKLRELFSEPRSTDPRQTTLEGT